MSEYNKKFARWEVKPIWKVYFPSMLVSTGDQESFTIFGVDRGALDIARNWDKIHSVEQFNQGYVAMPEDFTFTVAVKERGDGYEKLRRLAIAGVLFDVECDLLMVSSVVHGDRPEEQESDDDYEPWMAGFEKFKGCIIQREGQTVEIATFPIREFECDFLRHEIKKDVGGTYNTASLVEGDGTYPHLDDLGIIPIVISEEEEEE